MTSTFDHFGNLETKTDTAGVVVQTNTYDLAGRVLTSKGPAFTATVGPAVSEVAGFCWTATETS